MLTQIQNKKTNHHRAFKLFPIEGKVVTIDSVDLGKLPSGPAEIFELDTLTGVMKPLSEPFEADNLHGNFGSYDPKEDVYAKYRRPQTEVDGFNLSQPV